MLEGAYAVDVTLGWVVPQLGPVLCSWNDDLLVEVGRK